MAIQYRIEQDTADGPWVSPILEAPDIQYVRLSVLGAYAADFRARIAVDLDGSVLYGLSARGNEITLRCQFEAPGPRE